MSVTEKVITKKEFDSILAKYAGRLVVQKIGVYHGSLLYFSMETEMSEREDMFELAIWADSWWLFKGKTKFCESETITRDFAENELFRLMERKIFEGFSIKENAVTLNFSDDFNIVVEHDPKEDCDTLFDLSIPDTQHSIITLTNESSPKLKLTTK